jgi:hypothetical protein
MFATIIFPREVDDDSLLLSPDRWDNLPEAVKSLPGVYANMPTFSAGPRVRYFCHFVRAILINYRPVVLHRPPVSPDRTEDVYLCPYHELCVR